MADDGNWDELSPDERAAQLKAQNEQRRAIKRARRREEREAIAALEPEPIAGEMEVYTELDGEIPPIAEIPMMADPAEDLEELLSGLDPKVRALLSPEDINDILAEERLRAANESKKRAREDAREQIRHRMRVEHGLMDSATLRSREQNERLATRVRIRFDLPGGGAGHNGANGIRINGHLYEVRQWHTVTTAELESIREMHYNAWVNEIQFKTLDQTGQLGITTMNRLVGTTPARALFSLQPNMVEVQNAE